MNKQDNSQPFAFMVMYDRIIKSFPNHLRINTQQNVQFDGNRGRASIPEMDIAQVGVTTLLLLYLNV